GWDISTTMLRWVTWGWPGTRSTLWTGVAGTLRAWSRSSQSFVVRVRNAASTSGIRISRWTTRSRFFAKRMSRSHSGWSTARQNAPQNFSAKIATIRWPSRVGSAWYGTTEAWPEPIGTGTRPLVQKYCAMYVSSETWQSRSDRSI